MDDGDDDLFDPFLADVLPTSSSSAKAASKPGGKFQPKILRGKAPKPEPSSDANPPKDHQAELLEEKPSPVLPLPVEKQEGVALEDGEGFFARDTIAKAEVDETVPMDVDETTGEDEVVREIDVFFNPSLGNGTQLFLIQYPLRPSWRPYGLDRRCKEARMKPKQIELEFSLAVDADNENYDRDASEHLQTPLQILSGTKVPLVSSYAVGLLKGNQLHLNPVHAAVQLRPSMEYVTNHKPETATTSSKGNQRVEQPSENAGLIDSEDWVEMKFHPFETQLSSIFRQKMLVGESNDIQFSMNPHDYLGNLCPVATADSKKKRDPSRRLLLSMPPNDRFKLWFTQGGHVHRFSALMHLAANETTEDVLKFLPNYANLVQGLWVSKSSLFYEGREAAYREYVLFLFSKSTTIPEDKIPVALERIIMPPLARKRSFFKDWKFSEPPDHSFIKGYPEIVAEQEYIWSNREKSIMNAIAEVGRGGQANRRDKLDYFRASGGVSSSSNDPVPVKGKVVNEKMEATISSEAREALPKAIRKVLITHRVCGLNTICQHLRDMALSESQLQKRDPSASIAAAMSFINPSNELRDIISQVATPIHDIYVLKSVSNLTMDQFRNVVIDLLRGSARNAKLKKEQILMAAKLALQRDVLNAEYKQVLSELCVNKGGGWVLKSGDGKPE